MWFICKIFLFNAKVFSKLFFFSVIIIVFSDLISFFNRLNNKNKFEVIFFDPPFAESFFIDELKAIKIASIYKKNHLVIIHREEKSEDDVEKILNILLTKKYGRSKVIFGTF